ncbi:cytochrome P450 [Cladorrhinum sp. PSN332]|nr:cytochrome P450 [Cladorrhinum sp. PSN332]
MPFSPFLVAALGCLVSYLCLAIFKRYWGLRHIKGPFLASITDLWRFRLQYSGSIQPILLQLHKRYGPIVRIGPNTISVSDPAHINTIFGARGGFTKVRQNNICGIIQSDSYGGMRTYISGRSIGSIIDIQDEKRVKAIKRAIGTVFLANNLVEYEPQVDATLENLISSLHRRADANDGKSTLPFNLYTVIQHFQLDFLLLIAFGEDAGCLRQGKDVLGLAGLTYKRLQHWYSWQPAPSLERFIFQNPLWSGKFVTKSRWAREGAARVEARREEMESKAETKDDLLSKYFAASSKNPCSIPPHALFPLVNSTIAAGTDTTIGTLTAIFYFLLRDHKTLSNLLGELQTHQITYPVRYSQVKSLPYLDAIIKETLRLLAVLGTTLERTVPPQGSALALQDSQSTAISLPGGTVVGCSPYVIHRHEATFGPGADRFLPERWLFAPSDKKIAMEHATLSWSHGSRTCLGKNLAGIEMKKLVPALLLRFEFRLCDPELDIKFGRGILESEEFPIMVTATIKERKRN